VDVGETLYDWAIIARLREGKVYISCDRGKQGRAMSGPARVEIPSKFECRRECRRARNQRGNGLHAGSERREFKFRRPTTSITGMIKSKK